MKRLIAIASDHAGYALKAQLCEALAAQYYDVEDLGAYGTEPVDYPDYAEKLALRVLATGCRGVLLCGSGIGASIAANKIPGIRAGLAHDTYSAHQGVEHDDMNILVLGARVVGIELAKELLGAYLGATFSHDGRHRQRLRKLNDLEHHYAKQATE